MSWLPTLRIARAAWKGSKDPAGLIKSQLSADEPQERLQQLPAASPRPVAPAAAIHRPPAAAAAQPEPATEEDNVHAHLVLLRR